MMDLSLMRDEFAQAGLSRAELLDNPFQQFEKWFKQVEASGMRMPNAMTVSTISGNGQPTVRMVLLKFFDEKGFVFFTNYESRKAKAIFENPQVALHFPWHDLERQVAITGRAERVATAESVKYFLTRPKGSQIGAWVSNQSSVISSRQFLMGKYEEMKRKFEHSEVPLPSFWGGFRIVPDSFEFWQGRHNRLHDRFLYTLTGEKSWNIERLAP